MGSGPIVNITSTIAEQPMASIPAALAPMAGCGTVELAAAVCDAGGFSSISSATMEQQIAAETISRLLRLTGKPVNFFLS